MAVIMLEFWPLNIYIFLSSFLPIWRYSILRIFFSHFHDGWRHKSEMCHLDHAVWMQPEKPDEDLFTTALWSNAMGVYRWQHRVLKQYLQPRRRPCTLDTADWRRRSELLHKRSGKITKCIVSYFSASLALTDSLLNIKLVSERRHKTLTAVVACGCRRADLQLMPERQTSLCMESSRRVGGWGRVGWGGGFS